MVDSEVAVARAGVRAGALVALPLVGGAFAVRGLAGGLTALSSAVLVLGVTAASAWSLAWASRLGPMAVQGVALGGVLTRLALYGILVALLAPLEVVDGPSLAVTIVTLTVVVLAAEVRLALRHQPLWWIEAEPRAAGPAGALADRKERV